MPIGGVTRLHYWEVRNAWCSDVAIVRAETKEKAFKAAEDVWIEAEMDGVDDQYRRERIDSFKAQEGFQAEVITLPHVMVCG